MSQLSVLTKSFDCLLQVYQQDNFISGAQRSVVLLEKILRANTMPNQVHLNVHYLTSLPSQSLYLSQTSSFIYDPVSGNKNEAMARQLAGASDCV